MRVLKGRTVLAGKVKDCKGFSSFIGLRFTKSFGKYDAYIIHMLPDSILDSFFVFYDFVAAWLDYKGKVLKVEVCKPWNIFPVVKGQALVLELPVKKKGVAKRGDTLNIRQ